MSANGNLLNGSCSGMQVLEEGDREFRTNPLGFQTESIYLLSTKHP
jgi:hypothetical protein